MPRSTRRLAAPYVVPAFLAAVLVGPLVLAPSVANARPGGGQAFGSGGGGMGGGVGSGGIGHSTSGTDASFAPSTLSANATMGLLLVALGIVGVLALTSGASRSSEGPPGTPSPAPKRRRRDAERGNDVRERLRGLVAFDPSFSVPVLEDFSSALYTEVVLAAGKGELDRFAPYLSEEARATLAERDLAGVSVVLVGGLDLRDVSKLEGPAAKVSVELEIRALHSRRDDAGAEQASYVVERWVLRRAKALKSRAPDRARVLACPSCAGPLDALLAGRCRYCNEDVASGAFDWVVASVRVLREAEHGPVLTAEARAPLATDDDDEPTAPRARADFDALVARDDEGAHAALVARVESVFATFHEAWSARDLEPMRALTTDALFASQSFWIREYEAQGLRNVTNDATIERIRVVRAGTDAYVDTVTVRIDARAKDFVVDDEGALVTGDPDHSIPYTEHWTFVRKRPEGEGTGARTDCPRCGAPRGRDVAGRCLHCEATVTNRADGWVLSRIDQDEVDDD